MSRQQDPYMSCRSRGLDLGLRATLPSHPITYNTYQRAAFGCFSTAPGPGGAALNPTSGRLREGLCTECCRHWASAGTDDDWFPGRNEGPLLKCQRLPLCPRSETAATPTCPRRVLVFRSSVAPRRRESLALHITRDLNLEATPNGSPPLCGVVDLRSPTLCQGGGGWRETEASQGYSDSLGVLAFRGLVDVVFCHRIGRRQWHDTYLSSTVEPC